jgi:hypothetical protein
MNRTLLILRNFISEWLENGFLAQQVSATLFGILWVNTNFRHYPSVSSISGFQQNAVRAYRLAFWCFMKLRMFIDQKEKWYQVGEMVPGEMEEKWYQVPLSSQGRPGLTELVIESLKEASYCGIGRPPARSKCWLDRRSC